MRDTGLQRVAYLTTRSLVLPERVIKYDSEFTEHIQLWNQDVPVLGVPDWIEVVW